MQKGYRDSTTAFKDYERYKKHWDKTCNKDSVGYMVFSVSLLKNKTFFGRPDKIGSGSKVGD